VPEIRTIGATTIIPIVEEEIVVTRRLILKEEVHMTKRYSKEIGSKQIEIGTERAEIVRLDAEGRVVSHEGKPRSNRRIVTRKSL
jgi:stress response protein YsnF